MREVKKGKTKLRVIGACAAARELGCSIQHVSEIAKGHRRSKRCEPIVKRMCKVVEVPAAE